MTMTDGIAKDDIARYVAEHSEDYQLYLQSKAREFLLRKWWASAVMFLLCSLNLVNLDPSVLLSAICPLAAAILISITEWRFPRFSRLLLFDFFCFSIIAYSFAVVWHYHSQGVTTGNAPVIQGTMVVALLSFRKSREGNAIRNCLMSLVAPALAFAAWNRLDINVCWQSVIGTLIGGIAGIFVAGKYRLEFYMMSENTKARRHLIKEMSKVMHEHQIQMLNSFATIEETMPVGEGECVGIVLDVQGSSRFKDSAFKSRLDRALGLCYRQMMHGYKWNEAGIKARAYRVKENYDGFICTVGFPFTCSGNIEDSAISLSLDFIKVFNNEFRGYSETIKCGVGVVKSTAEGYFPSVGPKIYDMRGDALVLAKRYESFRSVIFSEYEQRRGHIIVLNESCYEGLSADAKKDFVIIPLEKHSIRDDQTAKAVYYRLL